MPAFRGVLSYWPPESVDDSFDSHKHAVANEKVPFGLLQRTLALVWSDPLLLLCVGA